MYSAFQYVIGLVGHRLQPFIGGLLTGHLNGQMAEPAVLLSAVPMLHLCWDGDHIAGLQSLGRLALLLIPALAVNTDEQLSAAALRVVER